MHPHPAAAAALMRVQRALTLAALAGSAAATGPCRPPCDDTPPGIPKDFDCSMRSLTMTMAKEKALGPPGYDLRIVHEALQLGSKCGVDYDELIHGQSVPHPKAEECEGTCIYVDGAHGDDSSSGGDEGSPKMTLAAGVAAARAAAGGVAATVILRGGIHWLSATLVLTPADNGITIRGYRGENATVSGAVPLDDLSWQPHDSQSGVWVTDVSAYELTKMPGLRLNGERVQLARHPNGDPERQVTNFQYEIHPV